MYTNTKLFPSFREGIKELRANLPYIKTYTGESFKEEEVVAAMMEYVKNHYPSYDNPEFPAVPALSVKAAGILMRIGNSYSFGWKACRSKADGTRDYKFSISFFNGIVTANERKFGENGWQQQELEERNIYHNKKKTNALSETTEASPAVEKDEAVEKQEETTASPTTPATSDIPKEEVQQPQNEEGKTLQDV